MKLTRLIGLLLFFLLLNPLSFARFKGTNSLQHKFNAHTLAKGQSQFGISGNFRTGITKNTEIGTNLWLLLTLSPNLLVKHQMFSLGKHKFGTELHLTYLSASKGLFTIASLVDTITLSKKFSVNTGLFFLQASGSIKVDIPDSDPVDVRGEGVALSPFVGFDWVPDRKIAFTGLLFYPPFLSYDIETPRGDMFISALLYKSPFAFLSATFGFENFYLEMGGAAMKVGELPGVLPFINLYYKTSF